MSVYLTTFSLWAPTHYFNKLANVTYVFIKLIEFSTYQPVFIFYLRFLAQHSPGSGG